MEIKKRDLFRILMMAVLLYLLYSAGAPTEFILLFAVIYGGFIFFRVKIKNLVDVLLHTHIPGFEKFPSWAKAAAVFICFILIYVLLKELVYFGLMQVGIDIKQIIMKSFVGSNAS